MTSKKGERPQKCIFLGYKLKKKIAGGPLLHPPPSPQTYFLEKKIKGGGEMIKMHNIYPWVQGNRKRGREKSINCNKNGVKFKK